MADNVVLNSGSGGVTAAADEISSVVYQRVKITQGADGVNDGDVAKANPLPVGGNTSKTGSGTLYALLVDANGRLQIDVVSSLPAGTNAIGKLSPNSGIDIGDVDVLSLPASTNTLEVVGDAAENAAAVGNPVLIGGRYDASPRTLGNQDVGAIALDADGAMQVSDGGNSLTVDGTITADLSATDNAVLDQIATAVEVIDDWDETNRAAVNLIASQVGISAGSGTVAANSPRVVLATDVALPAGTNAIGKLSPNSGVDIGDVDILTQPARDRLTDNVGAALQTDVILSDTTALTPKFAVIDAASSGDNTLVALVSSKKIRVLSLFMVAAGTVNARFESGAGGTALSGQMNLVANSGFTLPFNPVGWFESGSGVLLNLELSAAISVDGCLVYVEV